MNIEKKYILLAKITELMTGKDLFLSKISLHQLVFILEELYHSDIFYEFKLYTYGPYSIELTTDLDYLFKKGILNIKYCQGPEYFGSKINLGNNYKSLLDQSSEDFLYNNKDKLRKVIESFGDCSTRSLELRGTIIYLYKNEALIKKESIIKRIQQIKPYFLVKEIENELEELNSFIKIK